MTRRTVPDQIFQPLFQSFAKTFSFPFAFTKA